jgi:hypothetical protein
MREDSGRDQIQKVGTNKQSGDFSVFHGIDFSKWTNWAGRIAAGPITVD